MIATQQDGELPDLETTCPTCSGKGGMRDGGELIECYNCHGAGALPTKAGEKVFNLLRNQFNRLLAESSYR